jgi:hypothetical protein
MIIVLNAPTMHTPMDAATNLSSWTAPRHDNIENMATPVCAGEWLACLLSGLKFPTHFYRSRFLRLIREILNTQMH